MDSHSSLPTNNPYQNVFRENKGKYGGEVEKHAYKKSTKGSLKSHLPPYPQPPNAQQEKPQLHSAHLVSVTCAGTAAHRDQSLSRLHCLGSVRRAYMEMEGQSVEALGDNISGHHVNPHRQHFGRVGLHC